MIFFFFLNWKEIHCVGKEFGAALVEINAIEILFQLLSQSWILTETDLQFHYLCVSVLYCISSIVHHCVRLLCC